MIQRHRDRALSSCPALKVWIQELFIAIFEALVAFSHTLIPKKIVFLAQATIS